MPSLYKEAKSESLKVKWTEFKGSSETITAYCCSLYSSTIKYRGDLQWFRSGRQKTRQFASATDKIGFRAGIISNHTKSIEDIIQPNLR